MIEMLRVTRPVDIDSVAALAREIWTEHYVPIIGQAQVDYMLANFQSAQAIARQIAEGCEYYVVTKAGRQAGYFALIPNQAARTALLSKIYVRLDCRGSGVGKAIVKHVEARCAELGVRELWLTVNRNNAGSIAFYECMGFARTGTLVTDIGNGFVMDDYRMARTIGPPTKPGRGRA